MNLSVIILYFTLRCVLCLLLALDEGGISVEANSRSAGNYFRFYLTEKHSLIIQYNDTLGMMDWCENLPLDGATAIAIYDAELQLLNVGL